MARILVVDDERIFGDLLKSILQSYGHEVLTAYNGRDALDSFTQCRPQFTLLDLRMPGMNGIEVLRQLRAIDPHAAVMILTAWGSDSLEKEARQLGATDFLSKSLSLDSIVASMEHELKHLGKTGQHAGASAAEKAAQPEQLMTDAILLADEDLPARDRLAKFLALQGYTVKVAWDGPSALDLTDQERPQLIVLDMDMTIMKGIEVLRELRAKRYTGGIIMLTNDQDEQLLKEASEMGSVDILGKPVEPERLMLAIQVGMILTGHAGPVIR